VNAAQLGAFIKLFDLDGDNTVDCAEFLTQFFKIGLQAKGMMGKPDTPSRLKAFKTELKERVLNPAKARRKPQSPSRMSSFATSQLLFPKPRPKLKRVNPIKKLKRVNGGRATSKDEKLRRRFEFGKVTARLDLSTPVNPRDQDICLLSIPEFVYDMGEIRELWLSNNRLSLIPLAIRKFHHLHLLSVDGNCLTQVPKELGQMTQLRTLHLARNSLTDLPSYTSNLTNLTTLILDDNNFHHIPESIVSIRSLQKLSLARNDITSIPAGIKRLRKLRELYLDQNPNFGPDIPAILSNGLPCLAALGLAGTAVPPAVQKSLTLGINQATAIFEPLAKLDSEMRALLKQRAAKSKARRAKRVLATAQSQEAPKEE